MATDEENILAVIARLRRAQPKNPDTMRVCNAAELAHIQRLARSMVLANTGFVDSVHSSQAQETAISSVDVRSTKAAVNAEQSTVNPNEARKAYRREWMRKHRKPPSTPPEV